MLLGYGDLKMAKILLICHFGWLPLQLIGPILMMGKWLNCISS